ncbi:MAG: hypothetical protein Q9180_001478 [Flavoplaca navasiana]
MPKYNERRRRSSSTASDPSRISTHGFIPAIPQASKNRDTISTHHTAVPPEDVLFRRRHAPERYEEDDVYFAHESLDDSRELPDSDLLKAVHAYTSDFYGKGLGNKAEVDFRSMDETALMCVGMLLEEYMQDILGDTGDLLFVEAGEEREGRGAVAAQKADRQELDAHEHGRQLKEIEEGVEQEHGGEESSSNMTETKDEHEALNSSESESTENGSARQRRRLVSEDSDSSV